ncbi:hypothetical protein PQR70_36635 [Paraburkholderia madseniana]|jgi:hypothetical protein|uniref:DNA-binding protein n=1 Tax=Paraburkholderia madseniana TaxID=2599607 RepID=A0A6N6W1I8_9BURK|nr:hypothetical protein [Paraburkholderia madseniana]KAE8754492.1 hypothetical protein FSO04_39470 [Paraburkholderia madseniana]NPT70784.1 hypothetical protein [Paraburkholderia madseniana]
MVESSWDIAMRRIDAEFDVPQFVASSLVRKIAASEFRLPATDRVKFQRLPDHVIERIEQIVRDAYLEASEDVGREILRERFWQQALTARRDLVADGELISEADFRQRLGLTQRRVGKMLADGRVFSMAVDNVTYYPALLADPALDRKRLQEICRIIAPAPPESRLDFLSAPRGSLGNRSPLQMLGDDVDFKRLRQAAVAWAAEWSRTVVRMYVGEHEEEPTDAEPLYTAAAEADPRSPLWQRASEALHADGNEWPLGPNPDIRKFTLFVARQVAGASMLTPEACVQIIVDGELIQIRIVAAPGTALHSETFAREKRESLVEIAKRVVSNLCKRFSSTMSGGDE